MTAGPRPIGRRRGVVRLLPLVLGASVGVVMVLAGLWIPATGHPNPPRLSSPTTEVDPEFLPSTYASPTPYARGLFGNAVALSGSTVVIAAPGQLGSVLGPDVPGGRGCVYVFHETNRSALTICDPLSSGLPAFGTSVAVGDGVVAVGDPGFNVSILNGTPIIGAGAVFLFDAATGHPAGVLESPEPAVNGSFGAAVAENGGNLVIGAPGETGLLTGPKGGAEGGAGHAYVVDLATNTSRTLTSPAAAADGEFGASVAISGNRVVVGAPGEAAQAGSAYLFAASSGDLIAPLAAAAPETDANFGRSVAVNGTTAAVGASNMSDSTLAGNVSVFDLKTNARLTITAPNAIGNASFGASLSMDGSWVAVGEPRGPGVLGPSGAAFVFSANNGSLISANLTAPTSAAPDRLGTSVAIDGTGALVGGPQEPGGPDAGGQAYLFTLMPLRYASPNATAGGRFGASLSINNDEVAIGSPGAPAGGEAGAGRVYFATAEQGPWQLLLPPTPQLNGSFGAAVALTPDFLIVGAPGTNGGDGAVYGYSLTSGTPKAIFSMSGTGGLGAAVSISGDLAAFGSPTAGDDGGGVFVYNFSNSTVLNLSLHLPGGVEPGVEVGASVSISGVQVLVGAPGEFGHTGAAFVVSAISGRVFARMLGPPDLLGGPTRPPAQFGSSVALSGNLAVVGAPVSLGGDGGAVYVYDTPSFHSPEGPPPTLTYVANLTSPDSRTREFGAAVATNGATIVVGVPQLTAFGEGNAGDIFLYSGSSYALYERYNSPSPTVATYLGGSLAIGPGGKILVGPGDLETAGDPGYADLFFL